MRQISGWRVFENSCLGFSSENQFKCWGKDGNASETTFFNEDINGKKSNVHVRGDGTTEVKLTPIEERKEFKEEEYKDPLKKPLVLDDGKWAVFSW